MAAFESRNKFGHPAPMTALSSTPVSYVFFWEKIRETDLNVSFQKRWSAADPKQVIMVTRCKSIQQHKAVVKTKKRRLQDVRCIALLRHFSQRNALGYKSRFALRPKPFTESKIRTRFPLKILAPPEMVLISKYAPIPDG